MNAWFDKAAAGFHAPHVLQALYPLARKGLFQLEAEAAHHLSMRALRLAEATNILRHLSPPPRHEEAVELMGLSFPNRVGLAAGLDKEGNTIDALGRLGFGFIEIGTITPLPQPGNPRPRLFRLLEHEAIVNRMGFNNPGIDHGVANVRKAKNFRGIVGFNIGKNKATPNEDAAGDYLICLRKAFPVADYIAVNLSSPNTPGLRELQGSEASARLLETLKKEQARLTAEHRKEVPLLFKVAPDLDESHIRELAGVFLAGGLDGLIATNTTLDRELVAEHPRAAEAGGLSGKPLFAKSTRVIESFAHRLQGKIPIIGVGGISSVADAEAKLRAGADLIQVYTSFIFQGPALIRDLAENLKTPAPRPLDSK